MISRSVHRVPSHTAREVNDRIQRETQARISYYAARPEEIATRLAELDQEWDIERALETGSAVLSLLGLTLSITSKRRWLLLPIAVQSFFLQHALQGWCPPLPVFRRLGFRTRTEIDQERYALRLIRSDFNSALEHENAPERANQIMDARGR